LLLVTDKKALLIQQHERRGQCFQPVHCATRTLPLCPMRLPVWYSRHAPVCTVHYTHTQYTASHTTMTLTVFDIRNIVLPSHRATNSSPEYGIMVTLIGWLRLLASWITPESWKLPRMDRKQAKTHDSCSPFPTHDSCSLLPYPQLPFLPSLLTTPVPSFPTQDSRSLLPSP